MTSTNQKANLGLSSKTQIHPLIIAAAVALILFCVVGIGVMTGLIPTVNDKAVAAKDTLHAKSIKPAAPAHSKSGDKKVNSATACAACGVVQSVNTVAKASETSGLGAIAGGIAGAVVGHQMGDGRGKSLATVAVAAGGAVAGNKIEQNMSKSRVVNVKVRMEDGTIRTVQQDSDPGLLPGDKVKIVDGVLKRR